MADIPGLGQGKPDLKIVREEYPLPNNRKELVTAFEGVLKKGGVRKFVIELGQPLRVERYVRYDEAGPEQELSSDDLYFAVRNAEMEQYSPKEGWDPFRVLFDLFQTASSRGLLPKSVLVHDSDSLFMWLNVPKTTTVFGVDVMLNDEVPDDVLLFVCVKPEEPDVIAVSLQTNMES